MKKFITLALLLFATSAFGQQSQVWKELLHVDTDSLTGVSTDSTQREVGVILRPSLYPDFLAIIGEIDENINTGEGLTIRVQQGSGDIFETLPTAHDTVLTAASGGYVRLIDTKAVGGVGTRFLITWMQYASAADTDSLSHSARIFGVYQKPTP